MKIIDFEIENFKGIKSTKIEISTTAPGNVITLIGLNESGKTTILEAISNFVSVDIETSSIVQTVVSQQRAVDFIPKALETNFSGQVAIKARIELDTGDIEDLVAHMMEKHQIHIDKETIPRKILVLRSYIFKDSDYKQSWNLWSLSFKGIKKRAKKQIDISPKSNSEIWNDAISFLQMRFPKVVYFPTFMFNIPDRIYLEDHPSWSEDDEAFVINRYFKQVLQDVADSLESNISLDTHIVDRIARHREEASSPLQFWATIMSMDAASQIKAVTNRLAAKIGRVVFSAWNEISGRNTAGKTVRIEWALDAEANNIPYLQLFVHDGEHDYAIHERSLGFRWFFTFFLFTQFRASRKTERGTIFLFDEPAANLHARAQTKLLESFGRIASGNKYIIYSTHSHYMIEPLWLEKAVIVENTAVDFEDDADEIADIKDTNVIARRYRSFVASNPERVSYFQPALDALKFSFGPLLPGKNAVIVEGKFDFHPLRYFQERYNRSDFLIIPAPSASEAGTLISLLRGLGTNFIVMLDDDGAGRRAAKVYRDQHGLSDDRVFTLLRFDSRCEGKSFESLYGEDIDNLAKSFGWENPSKGQLSLLFQELCIRKNYSVDIHETEKRLRELFDGLLKVLCLPPIEKAVINKRGRSSTKIK